MTQIQVKILLSTFVTKLKMPWVIMEGESEKTSLTPFQNDSAYKSLLVLEEILKNHLQ